MPPKVLAWDVLVRNLGHLGTAYAAGLWNGMAFRTERGGLLREARRPCMGHARLRSEDLKITGLRS